MQVELTPDQEAFIRNAIADGRYRTPEDVVRDAMARWEESERRRLELLSTFDEAEADLISGKYTDYTEATLSDLAEELKREARSLRDRQTGVSPEWAGAAALRSVRSLGTGGCRTWSRDELHER